MRERERERERESERERGKESDCALIRYRHMQHNMYIPLAVIHLQQAPNNSNKKICYIYVPT